MGIRPHGEALSLPTMPPWGEALGSQANDIIRAAEDMALVWMNQETQVLKPSPCDYRIR